MKNSINHIHQVITALLAVRKVSIVTGAQSKRKGAKYNEEVPEGKFLKKDWASRDAQRWARKSYRLRWKRILKMIENE